MLATKTAVSVCSKCGIRTYGSEYEAQLADVPFHVHLNGRIGDMCASCKFGNQFIDVNTEKELNKIVKEKNILVSVDRGIAPPSRIQKHTKYTPVEEAIEAAPFGEWVRLRLVDERTVVLAAAHLRKRITQSAFDFNLEYTMRSQECSLFFRKTQEAPGQP